jgi:DNA (cytosine-5)-methyltransferase 1
VAQRRRRVFVVGHLGDWQRAAQVLFERESVRRDSPPSREAREAVAGTIAARFGISRNNHEELAWTQCFAGSRQSDVAATLETTAHDYSRADGFNMVAQYLGNAEGGAREVPFLTCHNIGGTAGISNQTPLVAQQVKCATGDITHALTTRSAAEEDGTGRGTPLVPVVFKVRGGVEREDGSRGSTNIGKQAGNGYLGSEERAFTLAAAQDQFVAQPIPIHDQATRHAGKRGNNQDGKGNGLGIGQPGDPAPTLTKGDKHAVAQPVATDIKQVQWASGGGQLENDTAQALRSNAEHNYQFARIAMQVRRLTPVECERLQGFPDGYTNIPWRKKPEAPDGPRYKALGNSMAVPCMAWIGKRIAEVDRGD